LNLIQIAIAKRGNEGDKCTKDDECDFDGSYLKCLKGDNSTMMTCQHKDIFPMQGLEIGGTAVLTLLMALAVMSGIGGGGIIVPLLIIFYKLDTKNAVATSGFTILTGSITRYLITLNERHPDKPGATCVDYAITNVMLPAILMGSVIGVFFNIIFPDIAVETMLTLLLAFLTWNAYKKFR
jgi:hypothetical protein